MRRTVGLIARGGWSRSTMSAFPEVAVECSDVEAIAAAARPAVSGSRQLMCQPGSPSGLTPAVAMTARDTPHTVMRPNTHPAAAAPGGVTPEPVTAAVAGIRCMPSLTHARGFAASASEGRRSGGSGHEPMTEVVEAGEAARRVLEDPMSRLMASQGMPVGLSLGAANRGGAAGSSRAGGAAAGGDHDIEEEDLSKPPRAEPGYQMEAFSDMLQAAAAAARRSGDGGRSSSGGGSSSSSDDSFTAGVQRVGPSLDDSWGTTRESPADIARRIVESNMDLERGLGGDGQVGEEDDDDEDDTPMSLSPSEEKYASLEAMSAEIKKLDEVFEVLASVPWLDDDVLAEKELKGVAQLGLLGTLEEVGFNIRDQVLSIWSGERGAELAAGPGLEFRDQAALMAILYHTQQIEGEHGPPPKGFFRKPPSKQ